MGIITPQVVENYWVDISETQLKITAVVSRPSVLSSDMTVISHLIIYTLLFVVKRYIANMAVCGLLERCFVTISHYHFLWIFPAPCESLLLPPVMF